MTDHRNLIISAAEYFERDQKSTARLSSAAAVDVCRQSLSHGFVVVMIEGGIWTDSKFMGRVACIWNGVSPPVTKAEAAANNSVAELFIERERPEHDVFLLTVAPLQGIEGSNA